MSFERLISVVGVVANLDTLKDLATTVLVRNQKGDDDLVVEAEVFLKNLSKGACFASGNRGADLLMWGGVWNYGDVDAITDVLKELMIKAPQCFGNVIVFYEAEQSGLARGIGMWVDARDDMKVKEANLQDISFWWGIGSPNGFSEPRFKTRDKEMEHWKRVADEAREQSRTDNSDRVGMEAELRRKDKVIQDFKDEIGRKERTVQKLEEEIESLHDTAYEKSE